MFNTLIWPGAATPGQDQTEQLKLPIPDSVAIVITQRVGDAMTAMAAENISSIQAQLLCNALLEATPQLATAGQAQRICEDHGAVFTSVLDRSFSAAEGIYFYGEDFLIEHYSATGHWIESKLGELDNVCLDFVETSTSQPFAVCVCY